MSYHAQCFGCIQKNSTGKASLMKNVAAELVFLGFLYLYILSKGR